MTLNEIYSTFTVGSEGFVSAVEANCGFEISRTEIERISAVAPTAEAFESVWENSSAWTDESNG
ncbi:hypothetical protein [Acetobacter sicerae]|uniref:hypothetical protein n=1 Tax=Acetobacter sicerae TaxID=85325 RepID=UPI00156B61F2|nr:hypothetical protein [Acetobacter sicerae]NHN93849.1 hypothetical protein [Acetobacter sicerae]